MQSFDPPREFDKTKGVPLGAYATKGKITFGGKVAKQLPIALHEQTAFIGALDRVLAVDLASGDVRATTGPEREAYSPSRGSFTPDPSEAPILVTDGDDVLYVAAFVVRVPGEGTTPGHLAVELAAVEASTDERRWLLPIDLPATPLKSDGYSVRLMKVDDRLAVMTAASDGAVVTFGIDLAEPEMSWRADGYRALTLAGSTVIGVTEENARQAIEGRSAADGTTLWRKENLYSVGAIAAGRDFALVTSRDYRDGKSSLGIIDSEGTTAHPIDSESNFSCAFDERSTVVCYRTTTPYAFAMDAESAQLLWELPDIQANRVAPEITSAWHGAVYGETENGPVVLDARTGEDISTSPGIAPLVVNDRCGIALDSNDIARCYPATR